MLNENKNFKNKKLKKNGEKIAITNCYLSLDSD